MDDATIRSRCVSCLQLVAAVWAVTIVGCSNSQEGSAPVVPPPTVALAASAAEVYSGLPVRLSWTSTGATSCRSYGSWTGARPPSGDEGVFPPLPANLFGLSCVGPGGTADASVVVTVAIPRYRADSLSPMQQGRAINNHGDTVGGAGSYALGFIDNRPVQLAGPPPCEPPSCYQPLPYEYTAYAINAQRTVLISGGLSVMHRYSAVWQYGGGPAPSTPPGDYYFNDINDFGEIVGSQPMVRLAVLIRQGERVELTGACAAMSINNRGHITGSMLDATGYCGHLLLFADGVAQDLGQFPGASSTTGTAINFTDTIVGYAQGPSGVRAFRYTAAQGYTDLGSLGGSQTWAFDINGAGKAVGYSTLPGSSQLRRAFLFTEERLVDLNDYVDNPQADRPLTSATAINDAGYIVANGCRPPQYSDCIAFRLTPIYSR